jgi:trans-aconitate methyltransferase
METTKTVSELAGELSNALESKTRDSGATFLCLAKDSPQWMTDVIRKVHGDKLPDDTTYDFIKRAACQLADVQEDDPDACTEAIESMESDVYTNDLTGWLHARVDHVYFLTQALEEFEPKDGFFALQQAQNIHIREVGHALLAELAALAAE